MDAVEVVPSPKSHEKDEVNVLVLEKVTEYGNVQAGLNKVVSKLAMTFYKLNLKTAKLQFGESLVFDHAPGVVGKSS